MSCSKGASFHPERAHTCIAAKSGYVLSLLHYIHSTHSLYRQKIMYLMLFCFSGVWLWESIDGSVIVPLASPLPSFVQQFDLCVTGDGLSRISSDPLLLNTLLPHIRVFARVSPKQKVVSSSHFCPITFKTDIISAACSKSSGKIIPIQIEPMLIYDCDLLYVDMSNFI